MKMNTVLRWISPLLLATVITTGIRLVTDIASSFPFWNRPAMINLKDFLLAIVSCYIFDFLFRYLVGSHFFNEKKLNKFAEYTLLTLFLFMAVTVSTFIAHYFIDSPNYLIDFVISYVVAIPVSLCYYTMLRNAEISRAYAQQTLQIEKMRDEKLATQAEKESKESSATTDEYIFVKSDKQLKKIIFKEILFVKSMENYTIIHTPGSKEIIYATLKQITEALPATDFLQVHRSYVINLSHVKAIEGNMLNVDGHKIPVSRSQRNQVFDMILQEKLVSKK